MASTPKKTAIRLAAQHAADSTSAGIAAGPISSRIRRRCLQKGWDLGRLARTAGISRTTLYHLEKGRTDQPRLSTLSKIAAALEISPEQLCIPNEMASAAAETSAGCESGASTAADGTDVDAARAARREFDRRTNPVVADVAEHSPRLFIGWTNSDWDELYSSFGTGGALTAHGVETAAVRINRKRETMQQLQVVLETHLDEVAANIISVLYGMVCPQRNLEATSELAVLVAEHQARLGRAAGC